MTNLKENFVDDQLNVFILPRFKLEKEGAVLELLNEGVGDGDREDIEPPLEEQLSELLVLL